MPLTVYIASHARPQKSDQLVEFANGPLAEVLKKEEINTAAVAEANASNLLKNSGKKPKFGPERPPKMLESKPKSVQSILKPTPKLQDPKESNQNTSKGKEVTTLETFKGKEVTTPVIKEEIHESKTKTSETVIPVHSSVPTVIPKSSFIPQEELIELEVFANEDDESDFDVGEDWEYNEEDYDDLNDDESEDEYGRTKGSLFPFPLPSLIQKSIEGNRSKSTGDVLPELNASTIQKESDVTPTTKAIPENESEVEKDKLTTKTSEKRKVRFSDAIEVKTFEKDDRDVHGGLYANSLSIMEFAQEQRANAIKAGAQARSMEEELVDLLYPADEFPEFPEEVMPVVAEPVKDQAPKVSRFKASRIASNKPNFEIPKTATPEIAEFVVASSIVERDPVIGTSTKSPVGNTVERMSVDKVEAESPVSDTIFERPPVSDTILERPPVSSTIIERAPVSSAILEKPTVNNTILERTSLTHNQKRTAHSSEPEVPTERVNTNTKPRVSRFKAQRKQQLPLPSSDRIQELTPEEVQALTPKDSSSPTPQSFANVPRYPSALTSKNKSDAAIKLQLSSSSSPSSELSNNDNRDPVIEAPPRGLETLRPGLASGMRSLFPADVLAKADQYYQQSVLTEEQFIRAHLGNEEDQDPELMAAERAEYEREEKRKRAERNAYKTKPVMEDELVEREVAPVVDGRGMGFVPDKYLRQRRQNRNYYDDDEDDDENEVEGDNNEDDDDDDDDDEDYSVNRAEIAREYQKLRQSLIYQTGGYGQSLQELEVEPIEEQGRKVSRFKAARLSTRRM